MEKFKQRKICSQKLSDKSNLMVLRVEGLKSLFMSSCFSGATCVNLMLLLHVKYIPESLIKEKKLICK